MSVWRVILSALGCITLSCVTWFYLICLCLHFYTCLAQTYGELVSQNPVRIINQTGRAVLIITDTKSLATFRIQQ